MVSSKSNGVSWLFLCDGGPGPFGSLGEPLSDS